jgi:hypothetical protein
VKHLRKAGKGIEKRETYERRLIRAKTKSEKGNKVQKQTNISESNKKENHKLEFSLPY